MNSEFEAAWRRRFQAFGLEHDDDAGIAGWSEAGLQARLRSFLRYWTKNAAGAIWLDAGCGAGTYSQAMAAAGQRVIGLDYSLPSLVKARQRRPQGVIAWVAADVTRLPLPSGSCDGAICFGVLQALSGPERVVSELARVVRPGGHVWVDALNAACAPNAVRRLFARIRGRESRLRYDSARRLRELFRGVGFSSIRILWVPILPQRLQTLQPVFESKYTRALFASLPLIGSGLSHAFVMVARCPESPGLAERDRASPRTAPPRPV